jgi:phage baseplate assembly protein W
MTIDFGHDLSCVDDLDEAMSEVDDITLLAQAILRRLSTPRGSLWQDPDYGKNLQDYLSAAQTPAQLAAIPGEVRNEVLKDERIASASVKVFKVDLLEVSMSIELETGLGPFSLVISATQAAVVLVAVNR